MLVACIGVRANDPRRQHACRSAIWLNPYCHQHSKSVSALPPQKRQIVPVTGSNARKTRVSRQSGSGMEIPPPNVKIVSTCKEHLNVVEFAVEQLQVRVSPEARVRPNRQFIACLHSTRSHNIGNRVRILFSCLVSNRAVRAVRQQHPHEERSSRSFDRTLLSNAWSIVMHVASTSAADSGFHFAS
jgi:hypothetical protein